MLFQQCHRSGGKRHRCFRAARRAAKARRCHPRRHVSPLYEQLSHRPLVEPGLVCLPAEPNGCQVCEAIFPGGCWMWNCGDRGIGCAFGWRRPRRAAPDFYGHMDANYTAFCSPMQWSSAHSYWNCWLAGAAVLLSHAPWTDVANPLHRAYPMRLHPALPHLPGLGLAGWRGAFCICYVACWRSVTLTFLDEAFLPWAA